MRNAYCNYLAFPGVVSPIRKIPIAERLKFDLLIT
jgi:hypothetical protein